MKGGTNAYPMDWDALAIDGTTRSTRVWENSQGTDLNSNATLFDVLLDRALPEAAANSWVALEGPSGDLAALRVGRNVELSRADFAISARCARLNLKVANGKSDPDKTQAPFKDMTTRGTTAHAQSEPLAVVGTPIDTKLFRGDITLPLDRVDARLFVGQSLALQGEDGSSLAQPSAR